MRIIGFNFNKINIEKFSDKIEKLKINTSINVSEIKEMKLDAFKTKEQFIGVKFTYHIDYEPKIAKIELVGNIVFGDEPKITKDILKQWEDKKISEEIKITLFNVILRKSNLRALQLEEELNLPLHVSLPSLRKQENKEN